ncbi:STAS domain-containing protein [Paludisphaera mucosa]|uniref:STAS domain-containing protein n=1 Tax=Paludisphaera mucosa TaxID=3030827 RepID=A0ABT6FDL3_9BACT|nr:STAS domain-containing protein [Paludisphaera mucosa]MDG3005661.1 STAS domain-containing protein [Paludisphaera mucosa]
MTRNGDATDPSIQPRCPACGASPIGDVPAEACERCGRGAWFTWRDDGDRVVKPMGDLMHAHPLDQFLKSVEFRPGERLILDLADVHYIASEALGRLMALRKRLLNVQGRLTLRHLDADLVEIFRVTRIASFFDVEP